MTVKVKFQGGPRDGKTNNLSDHDQPPKKIPVKEKETKAVNMKPGHYLLADDSGAVPMYQWHQQP